MIQLTRNQKPPAKPEPKLALRKETLRDLSATQLRLVAGGPYLTYNCKQ